MPPIAPSSSAGKACCLADQGQLPEALSLFRKALEADPERPGIWANYGVTLIRAGRPVEAIDKLREAVRLRPDFAEGWNSLGNACLQACQMKAAWEAFTEAILRRPDCFAAHSNRYLLLKYRKASPEMEALANRQWREALTRHPALTTPFRAPAPESRDRIRIGFLSPDFRLHSVAYFLLPLFRHLDRGRLEIRLYSDVRQADSLTARFRRLADRWYETASLPDGRMAEKLRSHHLDLVFDLSGHFQYNRLRVLASRVATRQISWLGFPGSTGTMNIDGRLEDTEISLKGKRSIALPDGMHLYQAPSDAPSVQPLPFKRCGYFTFGSFNNAFKVSPAIAGLWGEILRSIPQSRLLLKARAYEDPAVCEKILGEICREGWIDPARILFRGRSTSLQKHLQAYGEVDLALDTWPYHGTTTTCEALWMGVPTLTLKGDREPSRVGPSLLHQVGLDPFIADSVAAYRAKSIALAAKPEILGSLRGGMRSRMRKSSLMDGPRFARAFENICTQKSRQGLALPAAKIKD